MCRACRSSRRCTSRTPRSTSTARGRPRARSATCSRGSCARRSSRSAPTVCSADVRFHDTGDDDFPIGLAKVRSRFVRHVGLTLGFRVEWGGRSVAYVPDHGPGCCPDDPDDYVPHDILELCDGVDLLIHDAQHTPDEYEPKRHWGHSTVDYAVHVARESGAKQLVLFHHDPVARRRRARSHRSADRRPLGRARRSRGHRRLRRSRDRPPAVDRVRGMTAQLHTLNPDPATMRTVGGHFATGITIVTAIARRRARRHGLQLVLDGLARPAARALLRREVVDARGRASRPRASGRSTSSARTTKRCAACSRRRMPTASRT